MAVKQYDPKAISMIVGGKIMSGFADGTFIEVERNEQAFTLKVGVDGEGTRAKSNNKSGKITITLMQSSSSNDALTAFAAADELSNSGAVPSYLKDNLGTTIVAAQTSWVQKYPKIGFAKDVETRQWVLETDDISIFVGGNS
jgi:hypothetical protein